MNPETGYSRLDEYMRCVLTNKDERQYLNMRGITRHIVDGFDWTGDFDVGGDVGSFGELAKVLLMSTSTSMMCLARLLSTDKTVAPISAIRWLYCLARLCGLLKLHRSIAMPDLLTTAGGKSHSHQVH